MKSFLHYICQLMTKEDNYKAQKVSKYKKETGMDRERDI